MEDLTSLPWPVGAVMAVLCYPIALLLSYYFASRPSQLLQGLSAVPLNLWPLFAGVCSFASLMSFLEGLKKRALYKQNQSLDKIRGLTWRQFEHHIGEYFKTQGYFVMETPEGPDGGVDLVLRKDGEKTYVQCKHWKSSKVGVEKVRALLGSMTSGGAHNGILVTTGSNTQPAKEFGIQHGIQMIDGVMLNDLINAVPIDEQEPKSTQLSKEPVSCPFCQELMIKRVAKRGQNEGKSFWSCSKFPECKGTRKC